MTTPATNSLIKWLFVASACVAFAISIDPRFGHAWDHLFIQARMLLRIIGHWFGH